ncbi:UNVERIFIED_CONTAM: protein EXORDIUM-like 5 [Sesamum radiatum]|uniref:Protein EXORDIUM-like 5 n=1 Tax=Sesamum radiatum TaxID=300843 RepID=A0AAW2U6N7_SESRA
MLCAIRFNKKKKLKLLALALPPGGYVEQRKSSYLPQASSQIPLRLQEIRGLIGPSQPPLPHGPRSLLPDQHLPHLVRKLGPLPAAPHQRLPPLHIHLQPPRRPLPSVSEWWKTVSLYTDQTGANISRSILIAGEYSDRLYSHGSHLTRLSIQEVIATAVKSKPFPVDHKNGIYLVLTATDVTVQDFCRAVCGFHYFTFASKVGYTLPYAWVGNSGKQCPEVCAYPFAVPGYMGGGGPGALRPPNGDVGVDGMISVIGHELAELSSNPLVNAWYAGEDPTAPTEIGDLCEGLYGTGGGGGYIGEVTRDGGGRTYNLNGRRGRKFLVQWIWSPTLKACAGPNALD